MDNNIAIIMDSLIPRGGVKPETIYVSLEDYLSRLSNLHRKIHGTNYRVETWESLCDEHKIQFCKELYSKLLLKNFESSSLKITTANFFSRDVRLENEFEMLLYSITTTLSSLTRVIACFLKGSTQIHSHSKLSEILCKYPKFEESLLIVNDACKLWSKELTDRRDAATHYIALSVTSTIQHTRSEFGIIEKNVSQIEIPKNPTKYNTLWEDILPTIGGAGHSKIIYEDGAEINELHDANQVIIVRREQPLEQRPEVIDGELYLQKLYANFQEYIKSILSSLLPHLKNIGS